jgi:DNA-binding transcriptional ArsR family regulator
MSNCAGANELIMTFPKLKNIGASKPLEQMVVNAQDATAFLKSVAQESRLMILCILAEGEKSVGDLETLLAQRQSTVSQHLARLRLDGMVATRRDGQTIYYSLANEDVRVILQAVYQVFCKKPKAKRKS